MEAPNEFAKGETVQLRSGGPVMTVQVRSQSLVYCIWFTEDGARKEGNFEISTLVKVEPPVNDPG